MAGFPPPLAAQLVADALLMGRAWHAICPAADAFDLKLEIFGENTCSRWHQDHFVGRAICTYTGHSGTAYTRDANVDFWELVHCGSNECVIRDPNLVETVGVGDLLLIKGTQFAGAYGGANALVHKSPEKRYDASGKIEHRLVLKLDVGSFGDEAEATARETATMRADEAKQQRL